MQFHIGDLLSISTGRLVSPDHIGGVYNILNFLTGDDLYTHQLPAACDAVRPSLLEQHPWLATVEPPEEFTDDDHVWSWLEEQVEKHGERHELTAIPEVWGNHDPLEDLINMRKQ